jgi:hypothetical protein
MDPPICWPTLRVAEATPASPDIGEAQRRLRQRQRNVRDRYIEHDHQLG